MTLVAFHHTLMRDDASWRRPLCPSHSASFCVPAVLATYTRSAGSSMTRVAVHTTVALTLVAASQV
jgi:hypothetical protein